MCSYSSNEQPTESKHYTILIHYQSEDPVDELNIIQSAGVKDLNVRSHSDILLMSDCHFNFNQIE